AAGRSAEGREGWDPWAIYDQVALGHPAVIWTDATFGPVARREWTAWDGRTVPYAVGEHAVTVVGVDAVAGTVTVADVRQGVSPHLPDEPLRGLLRQLREHGGGRQLRAPAPDRA
ncbi:MAG TPA: hypothetical protein VGE42_02310, partial [Candidatus Dormibacteraeota bacterium]